MMKSILAVGLLLAIMTAYTIQTSSIGENDGGEQPCQIILPDGTPVNGFQGNTIPKGAILTGECEK